MNDNHLPPHWSWVKLNQLIDETGVFVDGDWIESKDQDQNGSVRLIQLADIGDGEFRNKSHRFLTKEKAIELGCTFLKKGDILIARMPDPLGRACIFPLNDKGNYVTAVDVCILRVSDSTVDRKYINYVINSPQSRNKISKLQSGSTRKRISRGNLATIDFPLPPLPEQHLIVSKIETLFSELDKGIESLKTVQMQLKVYRQAVLKWAFEGKLTNENVNGELPKGWKWVRIVDLASKDKHALKAGPFGSSLKKEFYVPQGYKIYGQEQVISGDPFFGDYYAPKEKYDELKSNRVQPFDVLISLVGTVGKVLILPSNCHEGIINPQLIKVSLDREIYLPKFFKYYFESSTVKSFYSSKAQGTTMDVLNLGIIKTIPFPLCSLDEQEQIISEIESRLSVCDKLEATVEENLHQTEALRQSILKRAFEGRLATQN